MKRINPKIIIIGSIVIALVVIATIIYLSQKKVPTPVPTVTSITSSVPANGDSGVSVFDPIVITFNQAVDPGTILVTSDPPENWTISQTLPNSINVNHKLYLKVATTYTLTVLLHGSSVGTLIFETAKEQNDPRFLQSLQSDLNTNYPLATLTPHETPDYRVVYGAPLTFYITIKSSITTQDAISEVQAWVKANGIDPGTHKYIVVAPTPTP